MTVDPLAVDPFFGEDVAPEDGSAPPERDEWPLPNIGVFPEGEPVTIELEGDPVPWALSRANPKTGARFVPSRQLKHADKLARLYDAHRVGKVPKPFGVVVGMTFTVQRSKSHWWKGGVSGGPLVLKPDAPDFPTGRPDLSNLVKMVEDALTGVAWVDDDQVVMLHDPRKFFSRKAATIVRVWLAPGRMVSAELAKEYSHPDEPAPGEQDQLAL